MLQYCIKQILTNINKYSLHVLSTKLRYKLYFPFSIPTPSFPRFYYMLGANLGLLLYGEVSVMRLIYIFSYFPFGFEGRMWDLIISVLDHCLAFYIKSRADSTFLFLISSL